MRYAGGLRRAPREFSGFPAFRCLCRQVRTQWVHYMFKRFTFNGERRNMRGHEIDTSIIDTENNTTPEFQSSSQGARAYFSVRSTPNSVGFPVCKF